MGNKRSRAAFAKSSLTLVIVLACATALGGCNRLPTPAMLIKPPVSEAAESTDVLAKADSEIIKIARGFLPQGTQFMAPPNPKDSKAVTSFRMVGKENDAILVTYKKVANSDAVYGMILKKDAKKGWEKILSVEEGIDWASATDLVPGEPTEIMFGLGHQAGNQKLLRCYYLKNETLKQFTDMWYSHVELLTSEIGSEKSLAVWTENNASTMEIPSLKVVRFEMSKDGNHLRMVDDELGYKQLLPERLNALIEKSSDAPAYQSDYLNEMLIKDYLVADQFEKALQILDSISIDISSGEGDAKGPNFLENLTIYRAQAYLGLKQYQLAAQTLDTIEPFSEESAMPLFIQGIGAANVLSLKAQAYAGLKDHSMAIDLYEEAIKLLSENRETVKRNNLNDLGYDYFVNPSTQLDTVWIDQTIAEFQSKVKAIK